MGLPVQQLIVATNKNDILHRFISENKYAASQLEHTYSPSMDILVSSNFERYLFDLFDRDASALAEFMAGFGTETLSVNDTRWQAMKDCFDSASVSDEVTCEVIAQVQREHGVLLDPHTAIGVQAARHCRTANTEDVAMVTLSTAHPAKFSAAITAAGLQMPELPAHLSDLFQREEAFTVMKNDLSDVKGFVSNHV